jgi:hypothetical protein
VSRIRLVFFTARSGNAPIVEDCCCYTLSLITSKVDKVASNGGASGEMSDVAFIAWI